MDAKEAESYYSAFVKIVRNFQDKDIAKFKDT